ncbi:hypothetical protein OH146_06905 [Salinibacterium sp. SYSU T00001]|uniref:hypothetical protein n=1 Tax=Homoserinimonas sedimenticola TaxID=2986805 RepID=UPI002236A51F|nr:hypothetical protein [Salinibacterium sedimenticola]MCW4385499.1 hypothetical protein [Salinibacterium sedimenticola]
MTATVQAPRTTSDPEERARWHRPLLVIAALMGMLAVVSLVGLVVDPREVTGLPLWAKPLKFALSTAIYALTLAWLISQFTRFTRAAHLLGTITTIALAIEMVIITGFAATGETSHFNVSTGLHTAAWAVMAISIVAVWVISLFVAATLLRTPLGDPARALAIRSGAIIGVIGLALAFLMTGPQATQLENFQGIVGAHTVGLADGGPGLPLLGWSTVGGDLRIPHFVGMHALQALPLLAFGLELLGKRTPRLASAVVRWRLVAIAAVAYAGLTALVTWQALIGQPITRPEGGALIIGVTLAIGTVAAALLALRRPAA